MHHLRYSFVHSPAVLQALPAFAFTSTGQGVRSWFGRSALQEVACCSSGINRAGERRNARRVKGETALRQRFVDASDDAEEDSWEAAARNSWDKETEQSWEGSDDRWEKAWQEGEDEKRIPSYKASMADWGSNGGSSGDAKVSIALPVEVVSFDLDDTLWSTKAVIEAANEALDEHMRREHPAIADKHAISDLMKIVWKEKLEADPTLDAAPVNLTELRKAGLRRACELSGTDPSNIVESSFAVWRHARHNVEPYLFPGVLRMLEALKERGVRLVAITNGNAQTDDIPCLKDLFEFCVMAEEVGERKPQAGPFREAVRRAGYEHGDSVGGEWVHVGDDWASDCVGAKTMRMRAVLVRVPGKPKLGDTLDEVQEVEEEAVLGDGDDEESDYPVLEDSDMSDADRVAAAYSGQTDKTETPARRRERLGILMTDEDLDVDLGTAKANNDKPRVAGGTPSDETLPVTETVGKGENSSSDRDPSKAVVPTSGRGAEEIMTMGSSTFLVDSLMHDFMDKELDNISEVPALIDEWNEKYAQKQASMSSDAGVPAAGGKQKGSGKFCIDCGVKIPLSAKFCPDCGFKQEAIGD